VALALALRRVQARDLARLRRRVSSRFCSYSVPSRLAAASEKEVPRRRSALAVLVSLHAPVRTVALRVDDTRTLSRKRALALTRTPVAVAVHFRARSRKRICGHDTRALGAFQRHSARWRQIARDPEPLSSLRNPIRVSFTRYRLRTQWAAPSAAGAALEYGRHRLGNVVAVPPPVPPRRQRRCNAVPHGTPRGLLHSCRRRLGRLVRKCGAGIVDRVDVCNREHHDDEPARCERDDGDKGDKGHGVFVSGTTLVHGPHCRTPGSPRYRE
jgi:hypothetical protein